MGDLSDFQRGQIVGVRLAAASVTKTATLLGVSREEVSNVIMAYTNHGKTQPTDRNSGQKPKLCERDRYIMMRIVSKNHRTTAAQARAEFNIHLEEPVSTKTV
jgi:transposase